MKPELCELLISQGGVLRRRDHGAVAGSIDRAVRRGELTRVLPGVYTAPTPGVETLCLAAARHNPDCVVVGAAAARLLWWRGCPVDRVDIAGADCRRSSSSYRIRERAIPPELVVERGPVRIACPELSVLDLIPTLGGQVIDEALRQRRATLPGLWRALDLTPDRPGNEFRRTMLHDSRDLPWSEAERETHRALRSARITGWVANHPIMVEEQQFYADIAFPRARVVIEIDGFEFHGSHEAFVRDRWRWCRLVAAGWRVMPFPASATTEPGEMIGLIRKAIDSLR